MCTFYWFLLVFLSIICTTNSLPLSSTKPVEEKQHAICRITSDVVNATANATLTRKLEGVCTSDELHKKLAALEENLSRQIKNLHLTMYSHGIFSETNQKLSPPKREADSYNPYISNSVIPVSQDHQDWIGQTNLYHEETSLGERTFDVLLENVREVEAAKFNLTFQDGNLGKSFLYFWKMDGINETLNSHENDIFSTSFLLYGQPILIKFYPKHLGTKYMAFELVQIVPRKYRFTILNFKNSQKDLSSQILFDRSRYPSVYRVSHKKVLNGDYIQNGSALVKLTIFIDY